jgi:hypothetical protein
MVDAECAIWGREAGGYGVAVIERRRYLLSRGTAVPIVTTLIPRSMRMLPVDLQNAVNL